MTGLGFIGGGSFLTPRALVKGLTTAATMFCRGGIGIVIGSAPAARSPGRSGLLLCSRSSNPVLRFLDAMNYTTFDNDRSESPTRICHTTG